MCLAWIRPWCPLLPVSRGCRGGSRGRTSATAAGGYCVRPSGTEPAVRVMVEAEDRAQAERLAWRLADAIKQLS